MENERKKLYLYACINYVIGTLLGIVLFYGQMKNNPGIFEEGYVYESAVGISDLLRAWWLNVMWLIATFIIHGFLPLAPFHIVLAIRGMAGSYSVMYILHFLGIKEATVSVLPQCLSVLPVLMWFSVSTVEKRRQMKQMGYNDFSFKKSESIAVFIWAFVAAVIELVFFRILCYFVL